jgi:hypothetical protein
MVCLEDFIMADLMTLVFILTGLVLLHLVIARWSVKGRTEIDPYFVPRRNY